MNKLTKDFSLSASVAGVIATLISYAGPLVIIFQAAKAAALPAEVLSSWVWAISIGSGVLGIVLSLRYRVPVIVAWSAPGSALLVALLPGISLNEAVGAYLLANGVILLVGLALFAAIGGALSGAMAVPRDREAALITFLVTASGMSWLGLSAAFWGLIFGLVAHLLLTLRPAPTRESAKAVEVSNR